MKTFMVVVRMSASGTVVGADSALNGALLQYHCARVPMVDYGLTGV